MEVRALKLRQSAVELIASGRTVERLAVPGDLGTPADPRKRFRGAVEVRGTSTVNDESVAEFASSVYDAEVIRGLTPLLAWRVA